MQPVSNHAQLLLLAGDDAGARAGLLACGVALSRALVMPTAAAFTGAELASQQAHEALAGIVSSIEDVAVFSRGDLGGLTLGAEIGVLYFTPGSGLHLKSVLHASTVIQDMNPQIVVAVGEAAMAVTDPMIDPRGGAPTTGLGLEHRFCVVTGDSALPQAIERTRSLLGNEIGLCGLEPGSWLRVQGPHMVGHGCTWEGEAPAGFSEA